MSGYEHTDSYDKFAPLPDFPDDIRTNVDPLEPSDDEAFTIAQQQVASEEPDDKRIRRLVDSLTARLSTNAFAVPTDEEMTAVQACDGTDFTVYDPQAFADADFHIDYIVDRVLVENQPAVVAGPSKSLKTSVSIDLAISLATGTKFLDTYEVLAPKRVLFLSAESGLGVIRCTASRICKARDRKLSAIPIHWGGWVPRVKFTRQLAALRAAIKRARAEVVFIDPVYQSIDGTDAANVSLMGQQLKDICDQVLHFKATPILVHHSTKTSPRVLGREPLEIHDLAGAGVTEFFRQWVLLNRRDAFDPEQPHRLWLSAGGSAGHASHFALDIDEDRDDQSKCHGWSVSLQRGEEARQEAASDAAERKAKQKAEATERARKRHIEDVKKAFHGNGNAGLTKNAIREFAGMNATDAGIAIGRLLRERWLEECQVEKAGRKYDGYCRTKPESDKSDKSDKQAELSGLSG